MAAKKRMFGQKKFEADPLLLRFMLFNTRRRVFMAHLMAQDYVNLTEQEKGIVVAAMVEQYLAATEDLLMAYWTLQIIAEKPSTPPMSAYLSVNITERPKARFSSRRVVQHLRAATPATFARRLGLPTFERMTVLEEWLEVCDVFEPKPTRAAGYVDWLSRAITFIKGVAMTRYKKSSTGLPLLRVYNKIKHGSLFFFNVPDRQVVFPVARGKRMHWYSVALSGVDGQSVDLLGRELNRVAQCTSDLYWLRMFQDDHEEAAAAMNMSKEWKFTGDPVNLGP